MKQLSELDISPTPWRIIPYAESTESKIPIFGEIESSGENIFSEGLARYADARIMKAAPKMYELIYDAMGTCKTCSRECSDCPNHNAIWIQRARDILAEAAGESEVKR